MMTQFFSRLFAVASLVWLAAGCASAPARFYTLNSTAQATGLTPVASAVIVGPVRVPALVDHPQFTVQVGPNRVEQDEFNRWAEPLGDNIARVVVSDLRVLLGSSEVAVAPWAPFSSAYRVTINFQRFDSVPGKSAEMEAFWVVHQPVGEGKTFGRTVAKEPVTGKDFESLAAALSHALGRVSADIAERIRSDATPRSKP